MAGSTEFLPFATGDSANVEDQATWAADAAVPNGFSSGIASSAKFNKALRQGTFFAAAISQWIADKLNATVHDDGNVPTLEGQFESALEAFVAEGVGPHSFLNPGYATIPPGLILQWGRSSDTAGTGVIPVTFPIEFPNGCMVSFATNASGVGVPTAFHSTGNETATGMTLRCATASGVAPTIPGTTATWLAIGF